MVIPIPNRATQETPLSDGTTKEVQHVAGLEPCLVLFLTTLLDQILEDIPHRHKIVLGLSHLGCTTWISFLMMDIGVITWITYCFRRGKILLSVSSQNTLVQVKEYIINEFDTGAGNPYEIMHHSRDGIFKYIMKSNSGRTSNSNL